MLQQQFLQLFTGVLAYRSAFFGVTVHWPKIQITNNGRGIC